MIKWNNPGNCNGKQKADKRGEGEIKHVPIYPFPDTINTRSVRKRKIHMILKSRNTTNGKLLFIGITA